MPRFGDVLLFFVLIKNCMFCEVEATYIAL